MGTTITRKEFIRCFEEMANINIGREILREAQREIIETNIEIVCIDDIREAVIKRLKDKRHTDSWKERLSYCICDVVLTGNSRGLIRMASPYYQDVQDEISRILGIEGNINGRVK